MSFSEQMARDVAFMARAGGEIAVSVSLWTRDQDPSVDVAEDEVGGWFIKKSQARRADDGGMVEERTVVVTVPVASVAEIDGQGYIGVRDRVYAIESVDSTDGVRWTIVGGQMDPTELGDARRLHGF